MAFFAGCNGVEKETISAVKNSLKDPDSAQFQDVKGYCGEVNAKNSYGGYTGFKKFYISNGQAEFLDEENPLAFTLGWKAHCEVESKLTNDERTSCSAFANYAASVLVAKNSGVAKSSVEEVIESTDGKDKFLKMVDQIYKNNTDTISPRDYALNILDKCLSGEIKAPR